MYVVLFYPYATPFVVALATDLKDWIATPLGRRLAMTDFS